MGRYDKKSVLKRLSENWGKEDSAQEVEFSYLEKNFVRMMKKEDWILDDQTWNDLDMNRSFLKMNRTFTNPGQQSLYNLSRILQFDETELKRRDRIIRFFQMNREEREQ
ncbi:MAG: DNA mismatch repair protein MutS, partial [Firmicutes bacterium]|nr:DNA mismatch repair protein MutS [Bacillota bacterium]